MKYKLIKKWDNEQLTTIEKILKNRAIADIDAYLRTTDLSLHSPSLLGYIEDAVKSLINHINSNTHIYIQVDSDADGYCSAAVLVNYLNLRFPTFTNYTIGLHPGKQHGLDLEKFYESGASFAIVPDAGSNEHEKHKELYDKGYGCLVLDHHEAGQRSEHATVVNPQIDEYPNKNLPGAGIVYKFCKAIDNHFNDGNDYAENFLDLVAVATVGDMIDLRDPETKHLVQKGLSRPRNPFLQALIEKQEYSLKGVLNPTSIGFYIAPLINATIRVGSQEEKEVMFKAFLDSNRETEVPSTKRGEKGQFELITTQAARNAGNIRARQNRLVDKAIDFIEGKIAFEGLLNNQVLLIDSEGQIPSEITGLVANKIMSRFQKPTLILQDTGETLSGSGRGYDKSSLADFREFLLESNFMEYAEGHGNAFGASIKKDKIEDFLDYSNKELADLDFTPTWLVDFVWNGNDVKKKDVYDIGMFANYWGKGVDESRFAILRLPVTKDKIDVFGDFGKRTLKITIDGLVYLKFRADDSLIDKIMNSPMVELNIVGKANINDFNGVVTPQVFIEDLEVAEVRRFYF